MQPKEGSVTPVKSGVETWASESVWCCDLVRRALDWREAA